MKQFSLLLAAIVSLASFDAFARDWYVSSDRGKGKKGTIEKPARDLSFIIKKLKPGDVIHMAAGTYLGKNETGADTIQVPVQIIGGYSDDFSERDPWGAHRTILTGANPEGEFAQSERLHINLSKYRGEEYPKVVIDGLIIDQGPQNRYKGDEGLSVLRLAGGGFKPSPDAGALAVSLGKTLDRDAAFEVEIKNNIILNSAARTGAVKVILYKKARATVSNNVILNVTGPGLLVKSAYAKNDEELSPQVLVENNTVAFSWLYDVMTTTRPASALSVEDYVKASVVGNVFVSTDKHTLEYHGREFSLDLRDNLIAMGKLSDYHEPNEGTLARIDDVEDEAEMLSDESEGNSSETIKLPVSLEWAERYAQRVLIDRSEVEEGIKPAAGWQNEMRSMLGLPLQAGNIGEVGGDIWLHQLPLDDAMAVSNGGPYLDRGARTPGN